MARRELQEANTARTAGLNQSAIILPHAEADTSSHPTASRFEFRQHPHPDPPVPNVKRPVPVGTHILKSTLSQEPLTLSRTKKRTTNVAE